MLSQTGEEKLLSHTTQVQALQNSKAAWQWLQCWRTSFAEFKGSLWLYSAEMQ